MNDISPVSFSVFFLTRRRLAILLSAIAAVISSALKAEEGVAPAAVRFAAKSGDETPDFQRHVAPLLGRLGCNGRACHGSFQGAGGFRLSLFGYDFRMDHQALTGSSTSQLASSEDTSSTLGLRVDRNNAARSLILRKPTLEIDHEGGERFSLGGWEHHLLLRWIENGAAGVKQPRRLTRIEFDPAEVVFEHKGQRRLLKVIAEWQDGFKEDVTCLCRFRSNDDSIATIDANGRLTAAGSGDTHVIAFYDNGVAAAPVMLPILQSPSQENLADWGETMIDRLIAEKLQKLGVRPSPNCSDTEFLRRVSLDMTGTLPTPTEIKAFLKDDSPDKRTRKIDQLLERPTYAAWWANKLCDFTGCNPQQQAELGQELATQWYRWIYQRLRENTPYDQLVERIVLSTNRREGQSYLDFAAEASSYFRDDAPADFSQRDTMPHYWTRRSVAKPDEKALAFAHTFLGVRLQCAQCHKHPWDQWTKRDFQQFSAFFENVRFGVSPASQDAYRNLAKKTGLGVRGKQGSPIRPEVLAKAQDGMTIPWRELYIDRRKEKVELELLQSRLVSLGPEVDPRVEIMRWLRDENNPYFAKALVNRIWAGYFHVGIVEPTDDFNPANPPSNPRLLNWLSREFVSSGYDMKWLHRRIAQSKAYQRSWKPNPTNREDRRNFSRAVVRRLPAEVVYDAVKQAAASEKEQRSVRLDLTRRAVGHLSMRMAGAYAMEVFGKPQRAVNCDCERMNQPTLLQSVFLQNDPLIRSRLESSGWIDEIRQAETSGVRLDEDKLIRSAWLRTVSRFPTPKEAARARRHFAEAKSNDNSNTDAAKDLLWALINTKEFVLNH